MHVRRYYKRGMSYDRTLSQEYYEQLVDERGLKAARQLDTASEELVLDSLEEEKSMFFDCLQRVRDNPGWYMEHLYQIPTFRVRIKEIFPEKIEYDER